MRAGVLLVLACVVAVFAASARAAHHGVSRPPARLTEDHKTLWMSEWVACRHKRLGALASEIGVKIPPTRTVQGAARLIAKKAELPLWNGTAEDLLVSVDGCRNGILWRYYHES